MVRYPLIDDEHRMLLWLCRKVQAAIVTDMSRTAIGCACVELEVYTQFHLTSEENLMHEIGYPEVMQHIEIHKQLLLALRRMTDDIGHRKVSAINMAEFLNRWLISHIQLHDKKVVQFLSTSENRPIAEKYYAQFLSEERGDSAAD